ncbi:hypothetical protein M7I_3160 [Glarea lozoyensis 74030]|uniref:Uncharacterized protein n=1 Tax=Glarea lozoyensis (strain ATCC 74030 / MF5533) TaxID=1104152 RepID=H0EKT0_GLAL7|nr:hypothetical protein M7I_3160 [Glarea lozoyensis 74030]
MEKVKSPAYKNMSEEQLRKSIDLSRQILEGAVDLVDLNNQSLALRGKDKNNRKRTQDTNEPTRSGANPKKRKTNSIREESTADASVPSAKKTPVQIEISPYFVKSRRIKESSGSIPSQNAGNIPIGKEAPKSLQEDLGPWLKKIAMSQRTPFQKKVLVALCQVPRGRYTTYNAISTYLSSSPRAPQEVVLEALVGVGGEKEKPA